MGEGERRGEGGNSTGEALQDFGSEPQVTNISQLCHSRFFMFNFMISIFYYCNHLGFGLVVIIEGIVYL